MLLDGELVCLDVDGRPDFGRLRTRLHPGTADAGLRHRHAATLMIFDLLHLDGQPVWRLPYRERRARLDRLALDGPAWRTPRAFCAASENLAAATRAQGLEGVVAKRRDAPYQPGPRRTGAWLKIKHRHAEQLAVVGWRPGGRREPDGLVVARRAGRTLIPVGVVHLGPPSDDRKQLLDALRELQPSGLRRSDRVRELGITVEVHHHGRAGGQLRDPSVRRIHRSALGAASLAR
jgi:bifunctional non-homologous end joining protein LigD